MAITIKSPDGWEFSVDSLQEAVDLRNRLITPNGRGHNRFGQATSISAADSGRQRTSPEQAIPDAFLGMNKRCKDFVIALVKHRDGVDGKTLARETGEKLESVGGVMASIWKAFKHEGLSKGDVLFSEMRRDGPKLYRFLAPGPMLVKYADKLGGDRIGGGGA